MIRAFRRAAFFGLLGICLAGLAAPHVAWSQGAAPASKEEKSSEPRHELLFKVINFAILVGGLGYLLRKPLAEFFRSRSEAIQKGLAEGRTALEASAVQLRAVDEKLGRLEADIAAFKAASAREMEAERQRLQEAGAAEAARLIESTRAQIEAGVRAAKLELRQYAAQQAVAQAEELIRGRMDDDVRRRLVAQFVASLEKQRQN